MGVFSGTFAEQSRNRCATEVVLDEVAMMANQDRENESFVLEDMMSEGSRVGQGIMGFYGRFLCRFIYRKCQTDIFNPLYVGPSAF
jgi:hypothetical protein